MVKWPWPAEMLLWISQLSEPLHARLAWPLPRLLTGMRFPTGLRTVASSLRAAQLRDDYRAYYFLGSLGGKVKWLATLLLARAVTLLDPCDRLLCGLDDILSKRYGPLVAGAGIHHNPTPGPAPGQARQGAASRNWANQLSAWPSGRRTGTAGRRRICFCMARK